PARRSPSLKFAGGTASACMSSITGLNAATYPRNRGSRGRLTPSQSPTQLIGCCENGLSLPLVFPKLKLREVHYAVHIGTPRGRFSVGDLYAANVRCLISLPVDGLEHRPDPFLEVLLRPLHRLAIHPSRGMLGNPLQILQHPLTRDVMCQRGEAKTWFTPSFHCYLLKFRCHGRLIFSLHRRPCLPLHGAHVTQEQSNCR